MTHQRIYTTKTSCKLLVNTRVSRNLFILTDIFRFVLKCVNLKSENENLDEVGILKKLNHTHVLKFYEDWIESEFHYIITEYCKVRF